MPVKLEDLPDIKECETIRVEIMHASYREDGGTTITQRVYYMVRDSTIFLHDGRILVYKKMKDGLQGSKMIRLEDMDYITPLFPKED
jgi:hypothetical protein